MYTIDNWQRNKPYPLGVSTEFNHTYFSVVMKEGKNCGIILYDKKTGREKKIPFGEQNKFGSYLQYGRQKIWILTVMHIIFMTGTRFSPIPMQK